MSKRHGLTVLEWIVGRISTEQARKRLPKSLWYLLDEEDSK